MCKGSFVCVCVCAKYIYGENNKTLLNIKEDLYKWKAISYHVHVLEDLVLNMSILPKWKNRSFNPNKNYIRLFTEIDSLLLRYKEMQMIKKIIETLLKGNPRGEFVLPYGVKLQGLDSEVLMPGL